MLSGLEMAEIGGTSSERGLRFPGCDCEGLSLGTELVTPRSHSEMSLLCTEDGKLRDWQILKLKLPQNKPEAAEHHSTRLLTTQYAGLQINSKLN